MDPLAEICGLADLANACDGGDPAVRIAIIDGPVDLTHPCLQGASIEMSQLVGGAASSYVRSEHGTHVTSIIMGQPGGPVIGVAPHCSARVYPIYREAPTGQLEPTSQAEVARAINVAMAKGADIINISSGQLAPTGQAERNLEDAVRNCTAAGSLVVAAAGNDGCRCLQVPAALEGVLAVGACDLEGRPLAFSNFGDDYAVNGILAPGKSVRGASPAAGVVERSGTSFATPIVSGVVALLLSLLRRRGIQADAQAVRAALLASATPCDQEQASEQCLAGRLDVPGTVARLLQDAQKPSGEGAALAVSDHRSHVTPQQPAIREDARMAHSLALGSGLVDASGAPLSTIASPSSNALAEVRPVTAVGTAGALADAPIPGAAPAPASGSTMAMGAGNPGYMMVPVYGAPSIGQPGAAPGPGHQPSPIGQVAPAGLAIPAPALPAPHPLVPSTATSVLPSAERCGCGCVRPAQTEFDASGEKVFAIGRLFYDFGSEARLDYFVYSIAAWRDSLEGRGSEERFGPRRDKAGDIAAPYNPEIMARFLLNLAPGERVSPSPIENIPNANSLLWLLTIDAVPIYHLDPRGVYGAQVFSTYVLALWFLEVAKLPPEQITSFVHGPAQAAQAPQAPTEFPPAGRLTRISQAGHVMGTTRLLNGTSVPTLVPAWRGTFFWDLFDLLGPDEHQWPEGAAAFLERIYNEFRNVGVSPQDRALNYSAMNARQTKQIFSEMAKAKMRLDTVEIDRSTICRPESECYDVTYRFFSPTEVLTRAREVFQHTIDVSDTVPVPVGKLRKWQVA